MSGVGGKIALRLKDDSKPARQSVQGSATGDIPVASQSVGISVRSRALRATSRRENDSKG